MSGRDAFPRITPYELGFPDPGFADERFREIAEEARSREMEAGELESFLLLAQVGRTLQELGGGGDSKALLPTFGAFLFHAYHFRREGHPFYLVETATIRYLVETDSAPSGWDRTLPQEAGYLQLPRHLVWTRPEGDGPEGSGGEEGRGREGSGGEGGRGEPAGGNAGAGPAEDVDGIFWSLSPSGLLHLLAVTGIRQDRAGFSVLPVPPIPMPEAEAWMTRAAREEGRDFATTLPGGELERLYSLETAGELVKLAVRILAHAQSVPGAIAESAESVNPEPSAGPDPAADPQTPGGALQASQLPALRIGIGG